MKALTQDAPAAADWSTPPTNDEFESTSAGAAESAPSGAVPQEDDFAPQPAAAMARSMSRSMSVPVVGVQSQDSPASLNRQPSFGRVQNESSLSRNRLQVDTNGESFARYRAKNRSTVQGRRKKTYFDIHEADDFEKFQPPPAACSRPDCFGSGTHTHPSESTRQSPVKHEPQRSPARNLLVDQDLLEHARRRERQRQAANEEQFLERAVQRAKQREKRLSDERRAKGVYIEGIDPKINVERKKLGRDGPMPSRVRRDRGQRQNEKHKTSYDAYTIHHYRALPKPKRMGGLGADLKCDTYLEKKKLRDRARAHARKTAAEHRENMPTGPKPKIYNHEKSFCARDRALEFAKNVPKPRNARRSSAPDNLAPRVKQIVSPQVQSLLARHDRQREAIAKMRAELGL
jgi:hypothetical protein